MIEKNIQSARLQKLERSLQRSDAYLANSRPLCQPVVS